MVSGRARWVGSVALVVALAGGCGGSTATPAGTPAGTAAPTATLGATDPAAWVTRAVAVGGTTISVTCKGSGPKTVALVSGLGEDAIATWGASAVPELVARDTRVCTYDRPGLGASGPAAVAPTVAGQAADLAALVEAGAIPAPVVAVGQGYGTFIVRTFAKDHVRLVAGVVLIDPPVALVPEDVPDGLTPGQLAEYQALPALNAAFGDFGSGKLPPPPLPSVVVIHTDLAPLPPDLPPGAPRVPAALTGAANPAAGASPIGTRPGSAGSATALTEGEGTSEGAGTAAPSGTAPPVTTTTAPPPTTRPGKQPAAPGTTSGTAAGGAGTTTTIAPLVPSAAVTPEQRRSAQQQLARKSPYGSSVVVDGSGPYVQYWKPEAVADAIHRVLADTRGATR